MVSGNEFSSLAETVVNRKPKETAKDKIILSILFNVFLIYTPPFLY